MNITPTNPTVAANATVQLNATVEPATADQTVVWTSSNEDVATVDDTGLVTGVAEGSCSIFAAAGDVRASVTLEVNGVAGARPAPGFWDDDE